MGLLMACTTESLYPKLGCVGGVEVAAEVLSGVEEPV